MSFFGGARARKSRKCRSGSLVTGASEVAQERRLASKQRGRAREAGLCVEDV